MSPIYILLGWCQWGQYRPLSAQLRREQGERRAGGREKAGAGAIVLLSPALAGGRRAGARRRAGVGREEWGGSDVTRFYWSTRRLK
jgi:hypothetical protein